MAGYIYNLEDCILQLGSSLMSEFAGDDGFEIEWNEDDFESFQGSHGAVVRVAKNNELAKFTLNIMQASPTNALLMTLWQTDKLTRSSPFTFFFNDLRNSDMVVASAAWITKPPAMSQKKSASPRVWMGEMANPKFTYGGGVPVGI